MAASRRDCTTRRGGHCVTNTGSGFSCVISIITNREYAGDQWSPVFYCFVGNHRSGCRNNRTGRRVSSSPKRSPCRLSPGAPAARRCRSRAHAACTRPRWSCRRGEHTAFMSAIGCSELFIASAPLPITVAVAISSAIGLANPARTPASARASRIISHRRLNGCIGDFLYLKSLNNEYKLDIQQ